MAPSRNPSIRPAWARSARSSFADTTHGTTQPPNAPLSAAGTASPCADTATPCADTATPCADTPSSFADTTHGTTPPPNAPLSAAGTPSPCADTPSPCADTPSPCADTPSPCADTPSPCADTPSPCTGASSRMRCALVPLIPNDETPARRGWPLRDHGTASPNSATAPADQSTCPEGLSTCSVCGSTSCWRAIVILITPATPAAHCVWPMFDLIDPNHSGCARARRCP